MRYGTVCPSFVLLSVPFLQVQNITGGVGVNIDCKIIYGGYYLERLSVGDIRGVCVWAGLCEAHLEGTVRGYCFIARCGDTLGHLDHATAVPQD